MSRASRAFALLSRRKRVAELYLAGARQGEIARELQVRQTTISNDVAYIRSEWLASMLRDFNERKAEELAKIDRFEEVAWQAWERSCKAAETTRRRREFAVVTPLRLPVQPPPYARTGGGRPTSQHDSSQAAGPPPKPSLIRVQEDITTSARNGDPRFLDQVMKCIETRLKVMGLITDTPPAVVIDWDSLLKREPPKVIDNGAQPALEHHDPVEARIQEELSLPPATPLPNGLKEMGNGEQPEAPTNGETDARETD